MNVRELIKELQKIKNKNLGVHVNDLHEVTDTYLSLPLDTVKETRDGVYLSSADGVEK